jgi:hypothetical protein
MKRRLFTFGCSYTQWLWPTWADILGTGFDEFQNWGLRGAGNRTIAERLSECILQNTLTENDLIVVQWTDYHRYDLHSPRIHPESNWGCGGNLHLNPHTPAWVSSTWNESSYIMHTLNFINFAINLLKNQKCMWRMTSSIDLTKDIDLFLELQFYHKLFQEPVWTTPIGTYLDSINFTGTEFKLYDHQTKKISNAIDLHPTPELHYQWLVNNFSKETISKISNDFVLSISDTFNSAKNTTLDKQWFFNTVKWKEWHHCNNTVFGL